MVGKGFVDAASFGLGVPVQIEEFVEGIFVLARMGVSIALKVKCSLTPCRILLLWDESLGAALAWRKPDATPPARWQA